MPCNFTHGLKLSENRWIFGGEIKYNSNPPNYLTSGISGVGFGILDTNGNIIDTNRFQAYEKYIQVFPGVFNPNFSRHTVRSNANVMSYHDSLNIFIGSAYRMTHRDSVPEFNEHGIHILKTDINGNVAWNYFWKIPSSHHSSINSTGFRFSSPTKNGGCIVVGGFRNQSLIFPVIIKVGPDGNTIDLKHHSPYKGVEVFPNPAGERLYFKLPENLQGQRLNLTLYNSTGQHLYNGPLPADGSSVGHLAPGNYFFLLQKPDGEMVKMGKWVKM